MSSASDHLSLHIWALAQAFEARLASKLSPHELTVPGFRMVGELMDAPEGIRPSELARRLGVSRPSVTAMVNRLRRDGVVVVVPDPQDKRAQRVRLDTKAPLSLGLSLLDQLDATLLANTDIPREDLVQMLTQLTHALLRDDTDDP
jgi:DNA-binding MarR family transcriptional regulator